MEPLWRRVLCWGAIGLFFGLPLMVFFLQIVAIQSPWFRLEERDLDEFRYLGIFESTLAALVFGLAGLNSWDKKNGNDKHERMERTVTESDP
jgi:hypothetical protein